MPGLLAGARLEQLDAEPTPLGPAHHHAQDHLGPVLRVGSAGARVDRHERIAGVVATREEPRLLQLSEPRLDPAELLADLVGQRLVLLSEFDQRLEIVDVALERLPGVQPARGTRVLRADLRGALLVVPEAGRTHVALELGDAAREPLGIEKVVQLPKLRPDGRHALRSRLGCLRRTHRVQASAAEPT